ncbi:NUDIX hydrolase [Virgibacillus flavescens]|uniref:NUDIX hydrolase n=1 Tax=Virgibacillus flavescens TaxID=1611422 RepID=UPI003D32540F
MLKYTVCHIRRGNELLLLNRNKHPNKGMWNAVGGKIERGETPLDGVLREAFEETGIKLDHVLEAGTVLWDSERETSGMSVFIAELPADFNFKTPVNTEEGILDWKKIDWVLDPDNIGIVDNIKVYLPFVLDGEYDFEYRFKYKNGEMLDYVVSQYN